MKKALALMTASAMALSLATRRLFIHASSTASSASSAAESVVESAARQRVLRQPRTTSSSAPCAHAADRVFIGIDDGLKQVAAEDGWDYTSVSFENDSGTAVTDIENMVTSGAMSFWPWFLTAPAMTPCVPHRKPAAPSLSSVASLLMSMTSASTPTSTISVP